MEIFGARGQDLSYPEMKWWTDHMHVSGVNLLVPHSFNPGGDPARTAPVGTRYFRKQVIVSADRRIESAVLAGTGDNQFVLFVNGLEAGHSNQSVEGWRNPVELDLRTRLRPGLNQLASEATRTASLLGFERAAALAVRPPIRLA